MSTIKPLNKVRMSISLALLMVISTIIVPASAQSEDFEFSTSGEILLLDSENSRIISVDHELLLSTGDVDAATRTTTNLIHARDDSAAKPISLTHDLSNLFIGYEDGWLEIYAKQDGQHPFTHWKRSAGYSLPDGHQATSLTTHLNNLFWTSSKDTTTRFAPISSIDDPWDSDVNWLTSNLFNNLTDSNLKSLIHFGGFSNSDSQSGGSYLAIEEGSKSALVVSHLAEPSRIILDSSESIIHLPNQGGKNNAFMVAGPHGLRVIQLDDSITATKVFSREADYQQDNSSNSPPFATTQYSRGQPTTSTMINFPQNAMGASQQCFPLTITFARTPTFPGNITLEIGGISKKVSHQDVSENTIVWGPEADNDPLTPEMCEKMPPSLEMKIIDAEDKNMDATVSIGDFDSNDLAWYTGANLRGRSTLTDATPTFGKHVAYNTHKFRSSTHPEIWNGITGISIIPGITSAIWDILKSGTLQLQGNERVDIGNVRPIQSVFDPDLYMQGKNMWWEIQADYTKIQLQDPLMGDIGRETIEVELLLQGVYCAEDGAPCSRQWRSAGDWEPLSLTLKPIGSPSTPKELVTVVRLEVPTDELEAGLVIPFNDGDINSHDEWDIRPAVDDGDGPYEIYRSGGTSDGIERGKVEWKIVIDPDNDLRESTSQQENNDASGTEYSVEWEEEGNFNVLIIPITTNFRFCDDWHWYYWNDCQDRRKTTENVYGDGFTHSDFEDQAELAERKMQEMFPIPEGKLHFQVNDVGWDSTWTERETINDHLGRRFQLTYMFLNLIDMGVSVESGSGWDRVIMQTASGFADDYKGPGSRHGGWAEFGGIAPCSTSAIVVNHDNDWNTADTHIHELGHTFLIGHDNVGFGDHTFNNCGHPDIYDPDTRATGWSPINPGAPDPNTGKYWDGQSFMRYMSDGYEFDGSDFHICDYAFNGAISDDEDNYVDAEGNPLDCTNSYGNWIQNDDYTFAMGEFNRDVGDHYLDDWLGYAMWNTAIEIWNYIKEFVADAYGWAVSAILAVIDLFRGWFNDFTDWAVGRDATEYIDLHIATLEDTTTGELHYAGGTVVPAFTGTEEIDALTTNDSTMVGSFSFEQLDSEGNILSTTIKEVGPCNKDTTCLGEHQGVEMRMMTLRSELHPDAKEWTVIDDTTGKIVSSGNIALNINSTLELQSGNNAARDTFEQGEAIPLMWTNLAELGKNGTAVTYKLSLTSPDGTTMPFASLEESTSTELGTTNMQPGDYKITIEASNGFFNTMYDSIDVTITGEIEPTISWVSSQRTSIGDKISFIIDHGTADAASKYVAEKTDGSRTLHSVILGESTGLLTWGEDCDDGAYCTGTLTEDDHTYSFQPICKPTIICGDWVPAPLTLDLEISTNPSRHEYRAWGLGGELEIPDLTGVEGTIHTHSHGFSVEAGFPIMDGIITKFTPHMDLDRDGTIDGFEVCAKDGEEYIYTKGWANNYQLENANKEDLDKLCTHELDHIVGWIGAAAAEQATSPDNYLHDFIRSDAQTLSFTMNTASETSEWPDSNQDISNEKSTGDGLGIDDNGWMILAGSTLILGTMLGIAIGSQKRDEE